MDKLILFQFSSAKGPILQDEGHYPGSHVHDRELAIQSSLLNQTLGLVKMFFGFRCAHHDLLKRRFSNSGISFLALCMLRVKYHFAFLEPIWKTKPWSISDFKFFLFLLYEIKNFSTHSGQLVLTLLQPYLRKL